MIEFRIDKEVLDLVPGTTTTINSSSPFFSSDNIMGEYSLPVQFGWTSKNLRLLGFPQELPVIKRKTRIADVDYSEDGLHFYKGTLIIEFVKGRMDGKGDGVISGYFLLGTSNFWQQVKNKSLRDLDLGGERTFEWNGFSRSTKGFWKHIHDTWTSTSDQMDYVFAPIVNEKWEGDDSDADFMNKLKINGNVAELADKKNWNTLVAHPYYIFLLKSIFTEHNYGLSGKILQDNQFKRLYMPSMKAIYWCQYDLEDGSITPENEVTFSLSEQVPDVSISDFLISLGNKFGWGYEFSKKNRACEIKLFRDIPKDARKEKYDKDLTPDYKISFPANPKIISLTQGFDGKDESVSSIDFDAVNYLGEIQSKDNLPSYPKVGDTYLVIERNVYYAFLGEQSGERVKWQKYGDNIYDYVQENDTDSIESGITACAMRYLTYAKKNNVEHFSQFPEIKRIGNFKIVTIRKDNNGRDITYHPRRTGRMMEDFVLGRVGAIRTMEESTSSFNNWTPRILFYYGMRKDSEGLNIPYSANHNFDNKGNKIGEWSLAYKHADFGLVDTFWAFWIKVLQSNERVEMTLQPKLNRYLLMQWSDILLVKNTPYMIQEQSVEGPYREQVKIKGFRLPSVSKGKSTPGEECPDCTVPTNLQVAMNGNKATFSFKGEKYYDYRIEWSYNNFSTTEGTLNIVNARPDPSGTITIESNKLPKDGTLRNWRVVHVNCGATCDGQGAFANGSSFTTEKATLEVTFSVEKNPFNSRELQLRINLSEEQPREFRLEGHAYVQTAWGARIAVSFSEVVWEGNTFSVNTIASNPFFIGGTITSYCASGWSLRPRVNPEPVVINVIGIKCD